MKTDESAKSPKVKINVNEFIVGDILKGQIANRHYDYFTLILPYDSDYILIDWQADNPTLVVNVGPERPTKENCHFDFPAIDHDTVHRINRSAIIKNIIYDDDDNSNKTLRGVELTIGIYSETSDSLQSSPYAFKLFMPPIFGETDKGEIISSEIIHIRSDQKVQCLPFEYDTGIYMCLFAIIFDDNDIMNNLIAYPRSQDGYPIEIYGDLVKAENIETNDMFTLLMLDLVEIFRKEHKKNEKYVYVENIHKDESYLLVIKTDDPDTIIEVLSSTYNIQNNMVFYPNPSTPQILAIKNNSIDIEIFTSQDLLINFGSVSGTGAFYWGDEGNNRTKKYYLDGLGDKLSFATSKSDDTTKFFAPLKVDSLTNINIHEEGFVFYITYYPRSYIDQVKRDSTTEIHYRNVKKPLDYYVPVNLLYPNTINFNIYNMDTQNGEDLIYESGFFNVWGTLISNTQAVQIRIDPNYRPKVDDQNIIIKTGVFDIMFATLYFSENDMDKFNPGEGEGNIPNIFFTLEPKEPQKYQFSSVGLELDISSIEKEFGAEPVPEKIYLTGNLNNTIFGRKVYHLKLNPNHIYLRVEFSANSYFVNYALSTNFEAEENDAFNNKINVTEEHGRYVIIVEFDEDFLQNNDYLYFIVFTYKNNLEPKLQYYVFKYITSQNSDDIINFLKPINNKLKVTKDDINQYTIKFAQLHYDEGVTYFIKGIYKDEVDYNENINSIAISEAKGINVQITNPKINDLIVEYNLKTTQEISYIKVYGRLNLIDGKYIYLYTPYETDVKEIEFKYNEYTVETVEKANKKARYELIFDTNILANNFVESENIPNYIKVKLSNYNGNQPPVLYFSPTDSKCIDNRQQLAKGGEMWVKKEQFQDEHFYLLVECPDENKCGYTLTFSGSDSVFFGSMGLYSYHVNFNNLVMVFKFKNDRESDGEHITLYETG
jgi:hypothetical protein